MKRKIVKHLLVTIIVSAIPACLSYLASSALIFNKLIELKILNESVNVQLVQDYCLWIGILLSAIFLSCDLIAVKVRYDYLLEERNQLIQMNKNILASALAKICLSNQADFDIRIFIPKHPIFYRIAEVLQIPDVHLKFVIKNIDLIAEPGTTNNLEFEVFPNQEGLVGECYAQKAMVYDDDLEATNSVIYNLGQNQIARTSNLKWSVCCPVFADSNTVVAILALDGKTKITIDQRNESALREQLVAFSSLLYDSVPSLFKR